MIENAKDDKDAEAAARACLHAAWRVVRDERLDPERTNPDHCRRLTFAMVDAVDKELAGPINRHGIDVAHVVATAWYMLLAVADEREINDGTIHAESVAGEVLLGFASAMKYLAMRSELADELENGGEYMETIGAAEALADLERRGE